MLQKDSNRKVTVLHSGGIDSTACLTYYLEKDYQVVSLFIDYGQPSNRKEFKSVKNISNYYKIDTIIIKVSGYNKITDGFIQGRNIFLISSALVLNKFETGLISLGVHAGTNYIDCSNEFIEAANNITKLYTNGKIALDAPFLNWSKAEIWRYCQINKIPIDLTYSCELGLKQPCNKCGTCKDLKKIYASQK